VDGYIKLDRNLLEKPIFQNEKLLKVWIWCLLKANHKPSSVLVGRRKIDLQPGQFITGRNKAGEELKMSPSTVRDYLTFLSLNKSIDIKPDNKFSLITVVNWELYQSKKYKSDSKTDNKKTSNQHQINTDKNGKNKQQNKYSVGANEVTALLKSRLLEKGLVLPRDWHLKSLPVAERLLVKVSIDELTACIKWVLADKYWSTQVDSMSTVERALPKYQLQRDKPKDGPIDARELQRMRTKKG